MLNTKPEYQEQRKNTRTNWGDYIQVHAVVASSHINVAGPHIIVASPHVVVASPHANVTSPQPL